ncbi:phage holin family protein [Corynebacterium sp. 320]|uniref:Phage holin family protein n=1 Tax=Corynebacterium zhongnanshanii TaxID=2768834 RepID=A0ABQ6VIF5_9CORY|nr:MULTISPECIES: phage holin family protein [Corynebacterium]KAB1502927.1 phage holin family protein [Corynebacterium sp. 320]KAB1553334.1 phage holin family protein [Corynebacterium sp. 321]KAB1554555.1 phage holin family protein [Corynebacterium sp. 319]KAB3523578.1 phage holin family protein [Corynebacterium zhongnanshanii]KAB3526590.1 phage holin family protein [Corynebacterium sp. 250]
MFTDRDSFNPTVNSIPLSDVDTRAKGQGSIGDLVKDASSQISSLVRSEIELAKTEVATSAKKAGIGVGLFAAAGIILAYSSFFLFFTIAEGLDNFMPRWLAFLIVFLFMIVLVAILALVGLKQVKQVKAPEKTIDSVGELKTVVPSRGGNSAAARAADHRDPGMYS